MRFAAVCRSLALSAKSGAKVLLFGELTKSFRRFFISIRILIHQCGKTHLYARIRVYIIYNVRARERNKNSEYEHPNTLLVVTADHDKAKFMEKQISHALRRG